jgi:hypothetical protein
MIRLTPQLLNNYRKLIKLDLNKFCEDDQYKIIFYKYNYLIENIENPSERCQFASIKYNPYNVKYIKNPSIKLQLYIIKFRLSFFIYIKNPSFKICQLALYRDIYIFNYINKEWDCYQEVKELYEFLTK